MLIPSSRDIVPVALDTWTTHLALFKRAQEGGIQSDAAVSVSDQLDHFELSHAQWIKVYYIQATIVCYLLGWNLYFARSVLFPLSELFFFLFISLSLSAFLHSNHPSKTLHSLFVHCRDRIPRVVRRRVSRNDARSRWHFDGRQSQIRHPRSEPRWCDDHRRRLAFSLSPRWLCVFSLFISLSLCSCFLSDCDDSSQQKLFFTDPSCRVDIGSTLIGSALIFASFDQKASKIAAVPAFLLLCLVSWWARKSRFTLINIGAMAGLIVIFCKFCFSPGLLSARPIH